MHRRQRSDHRSNSMAGDGHDSGLCSRVTAAVTREPRAVTGTAARATRSYSRSNTPRSGEEFGQNVSNKIDREVPDHVCNQIATPKIERSQDSAQRQNNQDVGGAACPVAKRKDGERNGGSPITIQTQSLESFDGVAA